jgi:hypothetical protein
MRDLTLILPFYRNPSMLVEQQRLWTNYPALRRQHLHVIVVDDGSPKEAALPVWAPPCGLGSARLYRITVDVRWNWIACRNLGVAEAATEWVLLTDIDHGLPLYTLMALQDRELDPKAVYRFSRVDAPKMTPYKAHPNTWLMTRAMYDAIGGYDERFSGFYGTDADFRERVHATASSVVLLPDAMVRYPREVIEDASTRTYDRKTEVDRENVARIRKVRARNKRWRPLRGTFPWERIR